MEQFAATYGLPGAVIFMLTSTLVWIVRKFFTGDIVTRREADTRATDKDAQIVLWRAVAETSQAQMGELLEHSRLSVQLLKSIASKARTGDET